MAQQLTDEIQESLGEARMVLPGIQALFGFQLICVFSERFHLMSVLEQELHFAALIAVAVSVALIITPAAYHRQRQHCDHRDLLQLASTCSTLAMVPLMLGMCVDMFLVARVITSTYLAPAVASGSMLVVLTGAWFVFPALWRGKHQREGRSRS